MILSLGWWWLAVSKFFSTNTIFTTGSSQCGPASIWQGWWRGYDPTAVWSWYRWCHYRLYYCTGREEGEWVNERSSKWGSEWVNKQGYLNFCHPLQEQISSREGHKTIGKKLGKMFSKFRTRGKSVNLDSPGPTARAKISAMSPSPSQEISDEDDNDEEVVKHCYLWFILKPSQQVSPTRTNLLLF